MSSSEVQRLTVEGRSTVVVPRVGGGRALEQYQPCTNEQVPIWAVESYNRSTADLDGMEALVSESISKSVHVQQEMPLLVDDYMSMISKQHTIYDQMMKGVETLCRNVYAQYTDIILQSQIFASNVKGGMPVIAAKVSQDYENLKDAFDAKLPSNSSVWAGIPAVLREEKMLKMDWKFGWKHKGFKWKKIRRMLKEQWQGNRIHNEWKWRTIWNRERMTWGCNE